MSILKKTSNKIVIIGDTNVGKTCIIERLINNKFGNTKSTIGASHTDIKIKGINLNIWDTAGQERFRSMINMYYKSKNTIDPCCGWGGRLLGTVSAGANYTGYEPNSETYQHLLELCDFLNINNKVKLYNIGAEKAELLENYDLSITSPPYYNLEIYSDESTQCENQYNTYDEWKINWLFPIIDNFSAHCAVTCWNVASVGKIKLVDDIERHLSSKGYQIDQIFSIGSSARQANQNEKRNKKNYDNTFCYKIIDN